MSLFGNLFGNEKELQNRLVKTQEANQSWKDSHTRLKQEHNNILGEITPLKQKCSLLQSDLNKHITKAQGLEKEKVLMAATINTQKEQITSLEAEREKNNDQLETLESELDALKHTHQNEIETMTQQLETIRFELQAFADKTNWVFLGEQDGCLVYRGYATQSDPLKVIRVKKEHVNQVPVSTEGGYDVFEDGTKSPWNLLDAIRTGSIETPGALPYLKQNKQNNNEQPKNQDQDTTNNHDRSLTENKQKIVSYITDNPGAFNKEISVALGMDKSNVSRNIKSLLDEGFITENEGGGYCVSSPNQ